jgi:hypothetical protein
MMDDECDRCEREEEWHRGIGNELKLNQQLTANTNETKKMCHS